MKRGCVFIDVANVWSVQKSKGHFVDYNKIQPFLENQFGGKIEKIFYYEAYPKNETRNYNTDGTHKFMTFLKKGLGFIVRKKPLKQIVTENGICEKGNMDVEIAIDALHYKDNYDTAIFFTGDSDFLKLATYLMNNKKEVYIFSSENNVSMELRTGTDGYLDLLDFPEIWNGPIKYRNQKK
jgi:uncharacterized LabA/DUF88 family protein